MRADRRALRYGGGGRPSVTLCDGGGVGRALRVTPKKIFYMYNIIL